MTIRDAREDDFEPIAEITNHYIRTTTIHFGLEDVRADDLRDSWRHGLAKFPFLVLEDEAGNVIGYAKAGKWRERAAYDRTAEIGVYLRPDQHGRGLGKQLYLALIERCREKRLHTLVGGIALPNEASIRLHEACGFTLTGTFRQVGWKFDQWHDVAFYQLML